MPKNHEIKLSIIIAAWNGISLLRECLQSLEKQTDKEATEIIVISNFPTIFAENDFSRSIRFITLSKTATVPELRAEGIQAAHGEILGLVEDHGVFDERWCEEIKKSHDSDFAVIGGAVENARVENALDWAVYFYDYGKYMLPNQDGAAENLSGINVSYKRAALEQVREIYQNGFFETFVNEELKKRGHQLRMSSAAIIYHNKTYELKRAIEHSYYLARSFAAKRVADAPFNKRVLFVAVSLILPLLLPARIVFSTLKKGRHLKDLTRSFPFLFLLMLVWSFGEFCGYLFGAGNSANEWR